MSSSTTAVDPELVAIFDLAGTVDGFMRAASRVEGLDFLTDLQDELVDPDDEFFYETDGEPAESGVPQSLYMVMTNAQAVTELVRLFELWQQDQSIRFERGLNPLKQVFGLLRSIRRWSPEDRVRETGLLEQWAEDLSVVGTQGAARVEIELWFRTDASARAQAESRVVDLINDAGGSIVNRCEMLDIAYHALLAEIPMAQVVRVLNDGAGSIELLTANAVMMVSPWRPMILAAGEPTTGQILNLDSTKPTGQPRVALLDGVPLANHVTLAGRLTVDDPDDLSARYELSQRAHGSAMASLIIHGDLANPGPPLAEPLYVRPLLEPHEHYGGIEVISKDELLVDLVHRAFHRMFKGDGDREPAAPSIRVVNLSIGDPTRIFVRRISPLARLIDWMAHRYNVVVVVSGGNHDTRIFAIDAGLIPADGDESPALLKAVHETARHRRLLSPAESINAITVGSTHDDGSDIDLPSSVLDLLPVGGPAAYTPVGFGFRRSVKPEVLLPGGRATFRAPPPGATGEVTLERADTTAMGPGLCVASPGLTSELDGFTFSCGTSNSAALASRSVNSIFDVLESLRASEGELPFPDAQYDPVVAKALLVHSAGWDELGDSMRDGLGLVGSTIRRELTRLLGYGPVRFGRIASAERARAVLIGAGTIGGDQRHTFRFPLPIALSAKAEWRRLTITLGWLSPVNVRSQKYRMARLSFVPPRDELAIVPNEADHNAVLKGTVQHQVLEGNDASAFVDGTVLAIDVDCRVDSGRLPSPVRFGLVASLEVRSAVDIDIQADVQSKLRQEIRERTRAQVPAT